MLNNLQAIKINSRKLRVTIVGFVSHGEETYAIYYLNQCGTLFEDLIKYFEIIVNNKEK
jgi:hypothetical protein